MEFKLIYSFPTYYSKYKNLDITIPSHHNRCFIDQEDPIDLIEQWLSESLKIDCIIFTGFESTLIKLNTNGKIKVYYHINVFRFQWKHNYYLK